MKKINKVFMVILFGVVELSSGVVKAEREVRGGGDWLCETYCTWCEGDDAEMCHWRYCNPEQPCHAFAEKLVECYHDHAQCAMPGTSSCTEEWEGLRVCADLFPKCGDGLKSSNESCDDGNQVDGDNCPSNCLVGD